MGGMSKKRPRGNVVSAYGAADESETQPGLHTAGADVTGQTRALRANGCKPRFRLHRASAGTLCPRYCFGGMDRNKNNPNWQDKLLGGAILTGFVVTAVIAVLLILVTWNNDQRKAASPETTVGSSTHASRPTPHSTN